MRSHRIGRAFATTMTVGSPADPLPSGATDGRALWQLTHRGSARSELAKNIAHGRNQKDPRREAGKADVRGARVN